MSGTSVRVIAAASLIVAMAMGVRQSFGIFLTPISMDLETGRQVFGLAIAVQNLLFGLMSPVSGMLADRFGSVTVTIAGAVLYSAGLMLATLASDPLGLHLTLGVLVGLGLASTTYVTAFGAVTRVVAPEKRSLALGIVTSVSSFGMFAAIPGAQALLSGFGWINAFLILGSAVLAVVIAAPALSAGRGSNAKPGQTNLLAQSAAQAISEAGRHSGYWLLNLGFLVCGFHVAFIAVHLQAHLTDSGLSPRTGALALALIGFFNIIGSLLFGQLGGRYSKKYMLSGIYLARAIVILAFIMVPVTALSSITFAAAIGFLWLATVPLTSGLVAQIFGTRHMSMLYGVVFASHQVGSFLGAWLGGFFYDTLGSYDAAWWIAIALGLVAALLHWPIADQPVARLQPAEVRA